MMDSKATMLWALDYRRESKKKGIEKSLFVVGCSLGGAVSIYISTIEEFKQEIDGVVLESTFTNIANMIKFRYPVLAYLSFLQRNVWNSIERVSDLIQPTLFIQTMKDETVPKEHMSSLYESANKCAFKKMYQIKDGKHRGAWKLNPNEYFGELQSFF